MKQMKWLLGLALLGVLIWYFFLKKEHYRISFETKQPPGVVYEHLKDWPTFAKSDSLRVTWLSGEAYSKSKQAVGFQNDSLIYEWSITRSNDSVTKVIASVTDANHPWKPKFQVPFGKGKLVSNSIAQVEKVGKELVKKSENFYVERVTDTVLPPIYCAYTEVTSNTKMKSRDMLASIGLVMFHLRNNNVDLAGDPFLQIKEWNKQTGEIKFDFCFPIVKNDSISETNDVKFKETLPQKALKAIFHGNYKISDSGWYYLIDYAERHHLEIDQLPTEIFLNDPHEGGNSLEWEAHILVPLK